MISFIVFFSGCSQKVNNISKNESFKLLDEIVIVAEQKNLDITNAPSNGMNVNYVNWGNGTGMSPVFTPNYSISSTLCKNESESYSNQIINNKENDLYFKRKINIDILLDRDILNDPNASVYKIDDYNYEIVIGKKFLVLLNYYSSEIVNKNLIFNKIDRIEVNEEKLYKINSLIFFFWTQFIILHEWAHIVNGHLDLKNFSDPYYEFNSTIKTNNESDIFLEMDADKLAGQLLINQFLIILNDLEIEFQEDKITLIDNFHKIMYHLFDMFFRIHEKNIKSSHPSYYDRIHAN